MGVSLLLRLMQQQRSWLAACPVLPVAPDAMPYMRIAWYQCQDALALECQGSASQIMMAENAFCWRSASCLGALKQGKTGCSIATLAPDQVPCGDVLPMRNFFCV